VFQLSDFNPIRESGSSLLGNLKPNGLLRLLLEDHCSRGHAVSLHDIGYAQFEQVASPKLTVECEIK